MGRKYPVNFDDYDFVGMEPAHAFNSLKPDDKANFTGTRSFMTFLREKGGYSLRRSNGRNIIDWNKPIDLEVLAFLTDLQASSACLPEPLQTQLKKIQARSASLQASSASLPASLQARSASLSQNNSDAKVMQSDAKVMQQASSACLHTNKQTKGRQEKPFSDFIKDVWERARAPNRNKDETLQQDLIQVFQSASSLLDRERASKILYQVYSYDVDNPW